MPILTSSDYDAVRAAIDLSLIDASVASDADQIVPDAVIELSIYQGLAEATVAERDPDFATRTGADLIRIKNAAIYFTASLLVPAIPHLTRQVFGDTSYNRLALDLAKHARTLWQRGENEIGRVLDEYQMPTFFDTASGYRGY